MGLFDPSRPISTPNADLVTALITKAYANLDSHSRRYQFPLSDLHSGTVLLIHPDYVHLTMPLQDPIHLEEYQEMTNISWPSSTTLLKSFIRTLLREEMSHWRTSLEVWAGTYTWVHLDLPLDVLDGCDDEDVKSWFNKNVLRDRGGFDKPPPGRKGVPQRKPEPAVAVEPSPVPEVSSEPKGGPESSSLGKE